MYIYIDLSVFYCLAGLSSRVDPARKKPSRRTGKTEAEKTGRKNRQKKQAEKRLIVSEPAYVQHTKRRKKKHKKSHQHKISIDGF